MLKAVAWDLDGTIIHFKIDFIRARQEAFLILEQNGISKEYLSLDNSIIDTIKKARKLFNSNGFEKQKIEEIVNEIEKVVINIEKEAAYNASAIQGIQQVLEFNKKNGLKQAIYTYNHTTNARLSLERVKLLHYFDIIAGRDAIENPKPHPDHLIYICENLNVQPDQVVVIGDHARDIEGALNIGAHSIGINSRLANRDTLEIAEIVIDEDEIPNKLIKTIENLLSY